MLNECLCIADDVEEFGAVLDRPEVAGSGDDLGGDDHDDAEGDDGGELEGTTVSSSQCAGYRPRVKGLFLRRTKS